MKNYYIYDGSEQVGPLHFDEIKVQKLSNKTPVWYQGLRDWTPAEDVPELLPIITPPPFQTIDTEVTEEQDSEASIDKLATKTENHKGLYILGSFLVVIVISLVMHYDATRQVTQNNELQANHQAEIEKYQRQEELRIKEELAKKNLNYRTNWDKYIAANNTDYSVSSLGGIYGLEVVLTNNTDNLLNRAVVAVSYLKANGNVIKQIKVPVDSVQANATKIVAVKNFEKGVAVTVSVDSIRSEAMHFLYAPTYYSGNPRDPNFYK